MDKVFSEMVEAMRAALAAGLPPVDAAVRVWERVHGSRGGLGDALLALADEGVIQGVVMPDRGGGRRVVRIVSVSHDIRPVQRIEKERQVFVVHGRDKELRQSMFNFLRSINLHPLEWGELLASSDTGTPYIGEVLDKAFERAQAIVVMLSPDEEVSLTERLGGGEKGLQARPNVLFEAGLALGRNPTRTIIVEIGALRPFSDIAGRHVVLLDDAAPDFFARRQGLALRLEQAGCHTSLRGTDWHTAGSFKVS